MIDYLVIGGGIAGLSAGAGLAPHGSVVLVEAEDTLGHHTSGRSAALYEPSYGKPAVQALGRASYDGLKDAGTLSPRGVMVVGLAGQEAAFEEDVAHMGLTEVTLDEAKALCPILDTDAITRAAYLEAVYDIDTDLLMQTYAKDIRANGGQVLTRHPVTAITRTAEGWSVTAGGTEFTAKHIVNAAGAWVDKIAEMAGIATIGFTPLRRSMARIPAPDGMDPATWPMVFGAGEEWYMKPDAGALIVSPAEEDPTEPHDAWADDMVLAEGLARFEENVTMEVTRLIANWAGLRTFSPDRVLVVGPDPLDETFFWCGGQGGYGFITAPAVRDLVEALVTGRDPIIGAEHIPALSPVRFR